MSLTIEFYKMTSDRRKAVKAKELIASKSCKLLGDCSLTDPVFIVTGDAATYAECNYCYVPAFKRYYFCKITSVPGGILEASCKCDVLSSAWENGLASKEAVIDRQEEAWNLYLNDGTFQAYCNNQVVTKSFSGGFSSPSFVLVVAG